MNRSFRVYYALGFVACIAWTPFSIGQLEGDPEIFRAVADVWRENFESIDTWEGEVSIDVQFVGKDAIQIHGERVQITATFWYSKVDRALKRVVDTHVGKLPNGKDDIRRQTVLRLADSVHALRMTYPARESTEPRLATVTISSPESDRVAYTTEDFDPLIWLRCEPFDVDVRMLQIYDNLDEFRKLWTEKPGVDDNVILRDGSLVTFSTVSRSADENFRKSAFTFDLSKGGLPVDGLWTSSKPTSGTHLEIQPIHIGEAWVPERARYHYRTNPKSERIVTVNWNQNIVNAPIAASVFDPSNLELVIGDPIVDLRTGIEQRFGIAESSDSYELKPAPTSTGTVVVVAFTVLILTLFLLNLRRKRNA